MVGVCALAVSAGAVDDPYGIKRLRQENGAQVLDGRGVVVAQVEPPSRVAGDDKKSARRSNLPDKSSPQFDGVRFHNVPDDAIWGSGHATMTARRFYGRKGSIAPGIADVHVFTANEFLAAIAKAAPMPPARVWSHSWIGGGTGDDSGLLRALDRRSYREDWVVVAGLANRNANSALLSSAFNILSVGRSDGGHPRGAAPVDNIYSSLRARPHLVAPMTTTSEAVPIVSAAAALLIQAAGQLPADAQDGARAMTVRAALMAGAERNFDRGQSAAARAQPDYRADSSVRTDNGLDTRFGAGQVHAYNSVRIVQGGQTDSIEDDRDAVNIERDGFDVDMAFGGRHGSNRRARYIFSPKADATLTVALVWPVQRVGATNVVDLNLRLYDATDKLAAIAASNGRRDTGEHLVVQLDAGRRYELVVQVAREQSVEARYALAWRLNTP